jgi:hypothetical protein
MENQPSPVTSSSQAALPIKDIPILKMDLTFADGFRFGCGFMSAILVFWIVLSILALTMIGIALLLGLMPAIR